MSVTSVLHALQTQGHMCNSSTNKILVNVNFDMCNSIWFSIPNGSSIACSWRQSFTIVCQHGLKSAGEEFGGNINSDSFWLI